MQLVEKISKATGLPQQRVLQSVLGLLVLFIVFGVGSSVLTNIVGVAYPAFMSFVALESEGTDDDKMWLTYWVVFGLFTILDQFAGIVLHLIPFYYVLKVAMLIWMFHPASEGAIIMYNNFILPFVKQYES
jgi:receptor expression-enhancing protein 5/6